MGSIIQNIANNITTSGVFTSSAITNTSISAVTALPAAVPTDKWTLIKRVSAGGAGGVTDVAFINGTNGVVFDTTYIGYKFILNNIIPNTDSRHFEFNFSTTGGGGSYNVSKNACGYQLNCSVSAGYNYFNAEATASQPGTGYQLISNDTGNASNENTSMELYFWDPANTTFNKKYMAKNVGHQAGGEMSHYNVTGYANTTSALTAVNFRFEADGGYQSGQGTIALYGLSA